MRRLGSQKLKTEPYTAVQQMRMHGWQSSGTSDCASKQDRVLGQASRCALPGLMPVTLLAGLLCND